jgi:hypothetical protein
VGHLLELVIEVNKALNNMICLFMAVSAPISIRVYKNKMLSNK